MRRLRCLGVCHVAVQFRLVVVCMSGLLVVCVFVSSRFFVLNGGNEKVPEDSGLSIQEGMLGAFWGSLLSCFGAARQEAGLQVWVENEAG